jgi:hypothetical protein
MDPYLQHHWRDVHHRFITYASDAIQETLPPQLRARVEERVVLETPEGISEHSLYPDLRVIEFRPEERRGGAAVAEAIADEPVLVELQVEPPTEGYIEIIDVSSGNRLVTVIEVLSPTNKMSTVGRVQYRHKQDEVCNSKASLVEIDLIRGGNHLLAFPLDLISAKRKTPYMVCVRRAWVRDKAEVYSMPLSQRLPTIKIPLRQTDVDAPLDLQALIDRCYRNGGYEGALDYRTDPDPRWTEAEATWVHELLRSKGLRPAVAAKSKRKRKPPGSSPR